jgi:hypothetical protein
MLNIAFQVATPDYNTVLASVVLVAAALALPVSFILTWLYRRAVFKHMRGRAHPSAAPSPRPSSPATPPQPVPALPEIAVLSHGSVIRADGEAAGLQAEALWAPWRTAAIYVAAGCGYALVMALTRLAIPPAKGFHPIVMLFLLVVFGWPAVLTVNLIAATNTRAKIMTVFVYLVLLAAAGAAASTVPGLRFTPGSIASGWYAANVPASLLLLTFLSRRVRAVGPLVLIFMLVVVAGLHLVTFPLVMTSDDDAWFRSIVGVGAAVGLDEDVTYFGLAAAGFLATYPIGWLGLRWVGRRYEQKKISDQSMIVDAVWLMFGMVNILLMNRSTTAWAPLSGLVAFAAYKLTARAGFALLGHRRGATRKGTRLLLLRVFALGKRSERLFGALAKHWRHVGSIQLIAGYDLATETVEPHKILDFLSRKLARRFIDGTLALELSVAELDAAPDRDGRYRVNDFFCREDTWKMVLSRLVSESDVVLMDLRGFTEQNDGCVFEIEELINLVPLRRVKFIVDGTTDEQFLRWVVQRSWCEMRIASPNYSPALPQLGLFRLTGSRPGELRQLLRALCVAAKTACG